MMRNPWLGNTSISISNLSGFSNDYLSTTLIVIVLGLILIIKFVATRFGKKLIVQRRNSAKQM
jgi:hypothetical protein